MSAPLPPPNVDPPNVDPPDDGEEPVVIFIDFNSIDELCSLEPFELLQMMLQDNFPVDKVIDAILANFSKRPNRQLLAFIDDSKLVEIITSLKKLVESGAIEDPDLDVSNLIRQTFSNLQEGLQNLFAILAFRQLLRSSRDAETPQEAEDLEKKLENLKKMVRLTLFHPRIVIHLRSLREERQQIASLRPCLESNAEFILFIGWYIAAQEAYGKNMFVAK